MQTIVDAATEQRLEYLTLAKARSLYDQRKGQEKQTMITTPKHQLTRTYIYTYIHDGWTEDKFTLLKRKFTLPRILIRAAMD